MNCCLESTCRGTRKFGTLPPFSKCPCTTRAEDPKNGIVTSFAVRSGFTFRCGPRDLERIGEERRRPPTNDGSDPVCRADIWSRYASVRAAAQCGDVDVVGLRDGR